jgi:hypothetical protein
MVLTDPTRSLAGPANHWSPLAPDRPPELCFLDLAAARIFNPSFVPNGSEVIDKAERMFRAISTY